MDVIPEVLMGLAALTGTLRIGAILFFFILVLFGRVGLSLKNVRAYGERWVLF